MSGPVEYLKTLQLDCPEAVAISDHIQSVLNRVVPTDDDQSYIGMIVNIPKLTDTIWSIAQTEERLQLVQPILTQMKTYFLNTDDLVPDHHGAIGLVDDAYVVYYFLHKLNEHFEKTANVPFIEHPFDFQLQLLAARLGPSNVKTIQNTVDPQFQVQSGTGISGADVVKGAVVLGLGAMAVTAISGMFTQKRSNSDQWVELLGNRVDHGW